MIAGQRPKHLNVFKIRLPLPGLVSFLHRISGAGLFLFGWALLYLLQLSLSSAESHAQFTALTGHWLVKLFLIALLWSFLHHFFAGLRFLLLDVHVGHKLPAARATSWAVMIVSLACTAVLGLWLW